jgi:hypothetical protein
MKKNIVITMLVVIMLSGCAYQLSGYKTGAGQSEWDANWLECQAMYARMKGQREPYISPEEMKTCMSSKGWTNLTVK